MEKILNKIEYNEIIILNYNELIKKDQLYNKVVILINKNPEWEEYLQPILEELKLANITLEYIQDKLTTLHDLEDDEVTDHKEEFKNLCLFIKIQLEEKNNFPIIQLKIENQSQ